MNTPNPLVPQGSLLQSKGKSTVRIAFFTIAAIHVVFIGGLLMQGCKKSDDKPIAPPVEDSNALSLPPMTNELPPLVETNVAPAPDTNVPPPVQNEVNVAPTPVAPPPTVPEETREYVVTKGDSFSTIAKKMGVSLKAIQQANPGVDSSRLQIGQKLHVPAAGSAASSSFSNGTSDNANGSTYTVKSGDMLEKIARHNGTTVKAIMSLNNLKTTKIRVGQKLKLPASQSSEPATPNYVTPLPPANP
jgi:LysM repeat protein